MNIDDVGAIIDYVSETARLKSAAKKARRMLWLGKFVFPKVNTKNTRLMIIPPEYPNYYFPITKMQDFDAMPVPDVVETRTERVEIGKFAYKGRRWNSTIRMGYCESADILCVQADSFVYVSTEKQQTCNLSCPCAS